MPSPVWQLAQHSACLKFGAWEAALNVDCPSGGLREWRHDNSPLDLPTALLGVALSDVAVATGNLEDVYVRGSDLVATYAATPGRPTRVQVYWRASAKPTLAGLDSLSIDLQISVQTHLLDSDPALNTSSSFQADEILRLLKPTVAEFGRDRLACAEDSPSCVLVRLAGSEFSYAEMVHPADHRRDTIAAEWTSDEPPKPIQRYKLTHELFLPPLEKGVILRARVRGVFLPRTVDESTTFAAYSALISAEPPLTT
jgi:hypothetical protein